MNPDFEDTNSGMQFDQVHQEAQEPESKTQIIRKTKLMVYHRPPNPELDEDVISVQRYNSFGSNLFPSRNPDSKLTVAVTSTTEGDGKTVVAANLATFFSLDTESDTVLVDLNLRSPKLHEVFGIHSSPGILDSLRSDTITVSRTAIKGLWVLPLGEQGETMGEPLGFDKVLELREILFTLKQHFRFVVIDLPTALDKTFPGMITSQVDGYVVVVSVGRTKRTDIVNLFTVLNESKVLGFVLNRVASGG